MKYDPKLIKQWAAQALAARQAGDARWDMLVLMLQLRLGWAQVHVVMAIQRLAAPAGA